ncbi:MAG: WD40/YVTN/BNR-like repeat-containing protein [Myxococcota bacterium]
MGIVFLALVACNGKDYAYETGDSAVTGIGVCGKVRGTTGVLMYQYAGDQLTVLPPEDSPDESDVTTGVAGPFGDHTYLAVTDGGVIRSDDAGCNWEPAGSLPPGDWGLVQAGDRVYAFDRDSDAGARSDDLGLSWSAFLTSEAFVSLPVADAANPDRLRGVQARGVVTTDDAGESWPVQDGSLPDGLTPVSASASPGDLEQLAVAGAGGVWRSANGGTSWDQIFVTGDAYSVAIHPDDATYTFAFGRDTDGLLSGWRHDGTDWAKLVTEAQIDMAEGMEIWPVPGNTAQAVSAYGPVPNNDDEPSLALYVMTVDEGTKTTRVTMYYHLHQLVFGPDRWVGAVDSKE